MLDQVLDFEHGGVLRHLGQIADSMDEWEGSVADQLGLVLADVAAIKICLLYTSPSPRDATLSRMPSSA